VRFRGGVTPWDAGGAPPRLVAWLESRTEPMRVLIPGCGSGYEAAEFAARGHEVLAIDFSDAALEAAQRVLKRFPGVLKKADFFALAGELFDLVYERAFLCALPRRLWPDWGRRVAELVRPGGELAGFFYLDDNERGPPYGIRREGLQALLSDRFTLSEDLPLAASESLPVFQGKEVWQVWRRKL
jgi:thiopurine S-methyltransferase